MDINTLLDFTEELLNMYGYETRRNVGIVGGKVTTAPLEKETGKLDELSEIPKEEEEGIVYKADILAEKKDIERPFGRIVVRYKRSDGPATPSDVEQLAQIREHADAHSGLLLTTTGATPDAEEATVPANVNIMTPEKVQNLLGKAMTKEKWWFNAPAYPVYWDYEKVRWKLKWWFEKMLFINYDTIWFLTKELAYEPYWKISYYVTPKKGEKEMKQGFFGLNALTGQIDSWTDVKPEKDTTKPLREGYFGVEAIHTVESTHMVPRVKIKKPKLPEGVDFVVYRPAMEKHEAKVAAIQWVSYVEKCDPEDVVITSRELIYYPWWKFHYFYRPIVKNAWEDTEWVGFKMSAVYGDIFNAYELYDNFQRDIIYFYMEKSLIGLLGRDRYVKTMRKLTYGVASLWWNYHLVLKPSYIWALLLLITGGAIYSFVTATWALSIVLGILLVLIFMGPGYALLYVLQDYLKRYPVPSYPHPEMTKKEYEKKEKPQEEAEAAFEELERLEEEGKLTEDEKEKLEKLREKKVDKLVKKAKKKD